MSAFDLFALWKTDPTARRIREAATRSALSHALLLSGDDCEATATYAAAAFQCQSRDARPCGSCQDCRKIAQGIHPDVSVVQDSAHKNIAVEVVRAVRADAYIRPNEGLRKVYIFPDSSLLTEQDQNVLLKIVEEGPPYAAFIFCGSAGILQTLRSRCTEWKPRPTETNAAVPEAGLALCQAVSRKQPGEVTALAVRLEKQKLGREELAEALGWSRDVFTAALALLYGFQRDTSELPARLGRNLTKTQIMSTIELFGKYQAECAYYVGTGHVLGALAVELEGIL